MVEFPNSLRSMFSGSVERDGEQFVVSVPESELAHGSLSAGETYSIAILERSGGARGVQDDASEPWRYPSHDPRSTQEPPVEAGDVIDVDIESVGDEGDGIARVDRGYVLIVPGGEPGDHVTVEIEQVTETVGFARIVEQVELDD